jgi:hypothetical protein
MSTHKKTPLVRLALDLAGRELMPDRQDRPVLVDRVRYHMGQMQSVLRRMQLAEYHGLMRAQQKLARDSLSTMTYQLRSSLDLLYQNLSRPNEPYPLTAGNVLAELLAMQEEFDSAMEIASDLSMISVTTDPIVLDDISLGRFRIDLCLVNLRRGYTDVSQLIQVEALEPNPASSDEGVTHPHVRESSPCLGDALVPIRLALRQGRFLDVFQMVISVLQTYNDGSAYVPLDTWNGLDCDACGRTANPDDTSTCEHCGDRLCDSCSYTCDACGVALCSGCSNETTDHDTLCRNCVGTCSACDRTFRTSELESGLCQNCLEQQENDHEQDEDDNVVDDTPAYPDPGSVPSPDLAA